MLNNIAIQNPMNPIQGVNPNMNINPININNPIQPNNIQPVQVQQPIAAQQQIPAQPNNMFSGSFIPLSTHFASLPPQKGGWQNRQ